MDVDAEIVNPQVKTERSILMEATLPTNIDDFASLFSDASGTQEIVVAKARAYLDARKADEEAEAEKSRRYKILEQAETELIRAMDAAGVKSLKIDHDGVANNGISQTKKVNYSLPAGSLDNPDVMEWLLLNGGADIVKLTVHHATFGSFCKELVEQASAKLGVESPIINPLHPLVKVAERRGIMLRKG